MTEEHKPHSMSLAELKARLDTAAHEGRSRFIEGTPEKYPTTQAGPLTVLEVEAMVTALRSLEEQLEAIARQRDDLLNEEHATIRELREQLEESAGLLEAEKYRHNVTRQWERELRAERTRLHEQLEAAEKEREQAYATAQAMNEAQFEASVQVTELKEQLESLLLTSERLFQMIPREVWRDQGGDDGQGHYEGEYRAEQIEQELHALRDSFPASRQES